MSRSNNTKAHTQPAAHSTTAPSTSPATSTALTTAQASMGTPPTVADVYANTMPMSASQTGLLLLIAVFCVAVGYFLVEGKTAAFMYESLLKVLRVRPVERRRVAHIVR